MFKFSQILPGIFHLEFDKSIELVSHFLRAQEFYESPKFKGKHFQLMDYIKWYMQEGRPAKDGNTFTYFNDWAGFNIPAETIIECHKGITDMNDYDRFIHIIASKALSLSNDRAYLIGTSIDRPGVIKHEIAHGLFHIESGYKKEALDCIYNMNDKLKSVICTTLINIGYCESVLNDEIQAYMSTGLCSYMKDDIIENKISSKTLSKERKPFIKLFNKYYK